MTECQSALLAAWQAGRRVARVREGIVCRPGRRLHCMARALGVRLTTGALGALAGLLVRDGDEQWAVVSDRIIRDTDRNVVWWHLLGHAVVGHPTTSCRRAIGSGRCWEAWVAALALAVPLGVTAEVHSGGLDSAHVSAHHRIPSIWAAWAVYWARRSGELGGLPPSRMENALQLRQAIRWIARLMQRDEVWTKACVG